MLAAGNRPQGHNQVTWDGRDSQGQPVPPGLYLYRLRATGFTGTGRMGLVR